MGVDGLVKVEKVWVIISGLMIMVRFVVLDMRFCNLFWVLLGMCSDINLVKVGVVRVLSVVNGMNV